MKHLPCVKCFEFFFNWISPNSPSYRKLKYDSLFSGEETGEQRSQLTQVVNIWAEILVLLEEKSENVSRSVVFDSANLWTVTHQAPLSMGFPRQESWSGLPCPFPGDLPNPGIKPRSLLLQADSLLSEPPQKPEEPANAGEIRDTGPIPWSGRSLDEGMATHSSILAWRIPRTEETDRL